ncbi:MAG: GyrI-like domain-containing protein [Myxococcales bacterium]|nr:GyrI-like domain-containing protein [Myxococcales bacterium]MBK7197650.1 GyrI-like domain-containing protein [Myxococcales bacterium]MBP6844496.1 GyrI-like domain-containing protein [Kofleriaceae bacterium]
MDTTPEMVTLTATPAIAIRTQLGPAELPAFFGRAFGELAACARDQIAGPPFARYHRADASGFDVEAVMPVRAPVAVAGRVAALALAGGPAVQIKHVGPYDQLMPTYAALDRWLVEHHRTRSDAVREVYLTNPADEPDPADWVTLVIQPVAAA